MSNHPRHSANASRNKHLAGFAIGLICLVSIILMVCIQIGGANPFAPEGTSRATPVAEASSTTVESSTTEQSPADNQSGADSAEQDVSKPALLEPQASISAFDIIYQGDNQPAGCEVTSLTMVLNYWGYPCTNDELADNHLPTGEIGDDMFNKMIGSVYSESGLGCFAGAIVTCAQSYAKAKHATYTATDISGASLEEYCNYVAQGYPVIVWATENMDNTYPYVMWTYNGKEMGYKRNEHCMVMIGYDWEKDTVTMADPIAGITTYRLTTFWERNKSMYNQAVLIKP